MRSAENSSSAANSLAPITYQSLPKRPCTSSNLAALLRLDALGRALTSLLTTLLTSLVLLCLLSAWCALSLTIASALLWSRCWGSRALVVVVGTSILGAWCALDLAIGSALLWSKCWGSRALTIVVVGTSILSTSCSLLGGALNFGSGRATESDVNGSSINDSFGLVLDFGYALTDGVCGRFF